MNNINVLLIGVGPHCKRVYLPALRKYTSKFNLKIVLGVDVRQNEAEITGHLEKNGFDFPMYYVEPFKPDLGLPKELDRNLSEFVTTMEINAVVISTEPLVHSSYVKWALKNKLHILLDKPISTRENAVSNISQAKGILTDYQDIMTSYNRMLKSEKPVFSVNVQRRFHSGYREALRLIEETSNKFNAPVTSLQSMHADGQWRLPSEIVTQIYHPYCQGYGKVSHSGYHLFDLASSIYKAGSRQGKEADNLEVYSSFIQPKGFIKQFNEKDYLTYFGKDYLKVKKWSDKQLQNKYDGFGEMDSFSNIRFLKKSDAICNVSINLLHNTFARRTWLCPGKDLYKGNGRVKHEYHHIQQGPFQNIQIHSYQSSDKHEVNTESDFEVGGNNHFDIYVFRNSGMFEKKQKTFEKISFKDLKNDDLYPTKSIAHESAKEIVVYEFLLAVIGKIKANEMVSNIGDHWLGVAMMSMAYQSHNQYSLGKNPVVNIDIPKQKNVEK